MARDEPLVSVLTPTYNHSQFIGECIESVLAQHFQNWEMLVLDDGSTDGTAEIAESFKDSRITVLRYEHRGLDHLADTYNAGLAAAKGDLVAILEGDDLWPAHKLLRQVLDFEAPEVVLSAGLFEVLDAEGTVLFVAPEILPPSDGLTNSPVGRSTLRMLDSGCLTFTFPVTVMLRRTALEAIGGFQSYPGLSVVDLPTFLAMGLQGRWVFHGDILGKWRRHASSTTADQFPSIYSKAYELVHHFYLDHTADIPASRDEIAELDRRWAHRQRERLIELARLLDHLGRKKEARKAIIRADQRRADLKSHLMLMSAAACYGTGLSAEPVFRFARRERFSGASSTRAGDPFVSESTAPDDIAYLQF